MAELDSTSRSSAGMKGLWRRLAGRGRTGSIVLVGTLFAGVLVASFGVGYSATTPELDNATNPVPHGDGIAEVNAETQRVENEARALAPGKQEIEVVILHDGRTAAVNNTTGEVRLFQPGLGTHVTETPPQAKPVTDGEQPAVVAGKDSGYVVEPKGNTVRPIGVEGPAPAPVPVPGGASRTAIPDGAGGIWVLTDDEKAVYIVRDRVVRTVSAPDPIRHLTVADGRPVGITASGAVFDIAADPLRTIVNQSVPSGPTVVVSSPRGAGRYLLVLDRKDGRLIAIDPRTRSVHEIGQLPTGNDVNLGAPVILDDRAYIPAYGKHLLYVRELPTGTPLGEVPVPGSYKMFSLEVRDHRVWAKDQRDQRVVVVSRDGKPTVIDAGEAPGVETDNTEVEKPKQQPPKDQPSNTVPPPPTDAPPPTTTTPRAQPQLVTVPTIPPGTQQGAACDRIRAVGLRCDIVEIGPGGPTGTVRDTKPPGGSRGPEGSVVRVSVYGPVSVPDVVGQLSGAACAKVESGAREPGAGGQLNCAPEAMPGMASTWSDLDVVAEQNPKAGARVERDTSVIVRFWNAVPMDNLVGSNDANACSRLLGLSRNKVKCTVQSAGPAPTPAQTGVIVSTTPVAGSPVRIDDPIVLQIYGPPTPTVGSFTGEINAACQAVRNAGYTCDARPDVVLARNANVVVSQEPPPGTPQQGGSVVLHYSPHQPLPVRIWEAKNGDPVYVLRVGDAGTNEYYRLRPEILGYAYNAPIEGVWPINDYYCTAGVDQCRGYARNHYMSRDSAPAPNFKGGIGAAHLISSPSSQCGAGQSPLYRNWYGPVNQRRYTVEYTGNPGTSEFLGCVWNP